MRQEERAARKAVREEARAKQSEQDKRDTELAKDAMRAILADPTATPQQRLDAIAILDHLTYSDIVPHRMKVEQEARAEQDRQKAISEFAAMAKQRMEEQATN